MTEGNSDSTLEIGEGTRVFLNFALSLDDGSEVDTNFGGEAVSFTVGDGSLLPGFEKRLFGMGPGERQMFQVPPEDAFGQPKKPYFMAITVRKRRAQHSRMPMDGLFWR